MECNRLETKWKNVQSSNCGKWYLLVGDAEAREGACVVVCHADSLAKIGNQCCGGCVLQHCTARSLTSDPNAKESEEGRGVVRNGKEAPVDVSTPHRDSAQWEGDDGGSLPHRKRIGYEAPRCVRVVDHSCVGEKLLSRHAHPAAQMRFQSKG